MENPSTNFEENLMAGLRRSIVREVRLLEEMAKLEAERDRLKNAIQEIVALCPNADPYDTAGPTSRGYYLALRDIKHRLMLELNTVATIEEDQEKD